MLESSQPVWDSADSGLGSVRAMHGDGPKNPDVPLQQGADSNRSNQYGVGVDTAHRGTVGLGAEES